MDNKVLVSIIMPVYNHAEYLAQAIESVLMQQVDFNYELLIGEDCSTDDSLTIIKKYEKQSDKIKLYAREINMGGICNAHDLRMHSVGKYMIILEGDDYWTDEYKLQKQVDFLENNPEYIACAHKFHVVNRYNERYKDRDFEIQFVQNNPYDIKMFEQGKMISHINTILFRNIFIDNRINLDFWTNDLHMATDSTITAILLLNGKIYCLDEYMTCYRKVIDSDAYSFSALQERKNTRDKLFMSAIFIEECLEKKIDFSIRKKNIFASAVFKWYRDKNRHNYNVIKDIIRFSNEYTKYMYWFIYLIVVRFIKDNTGKRHERVEF